MDLSLVTRSLGRIVDVAMDRTVAPGYTSVGLAVRRRLPGWPTDPEPDALAGRVALVTGASSGLGTATAEGLARLGAKVVLVVRNEAKGQRTAQELRGSVPGVRVDLRRCDVGDLDDVRRFVAELPEERVDVLVHNAGVMPPSRTTSAQGHELSMAVHVLGPMLMTDLLRPQLAAAGQSRVVLVTSGGMYAQKLRADDPDYLTGDYSPTTAYARSKRAQVELLARLQQRWGGEGAAVHATHPGWADTPGVLDSLPGFHRITGPVLRDAAGGADTTVWLAAVEPARPGGRLWHDRRARPLHLLPTTRPEPGAVDALWSWAREAAGLPR